ncbi:RrF2 family transcriptional regulator [Sphingomonas nostoxanthinifaciens]|uniref:RrF2 family transcriptional regulator n=1 Tax=Sphingomonas nostoxanthinifaciens TaxID=2872652 RepID=UPI001CC1EF03|nr:Rrf2 family transcriptional regulator [Sphingomonas nostoxanthinifaciens]UAK24694.1 Rrf2 family transcriptional regulator [Sphingomonas nostoxanthinifaciens]
MLSQRSRYALKALLHLAGTEQGLPVSIGTIAQASGISRKFLEAILNDLRREGLVDSTRGKFGGYRLALPADQISFARIIRASEGPLALFPCASVNFYRPCPDCDVATCTLRRVLRHARDGVAEVLERTTLASALEADEPLPLAS